MDKSPCRGCINEYSPKDDCLHSCERIGRLRIISHQFVVERTRPDYIHFRSHSVNVPG